MHFEEIPLVPADEPAQAVPVQADPYLFGVDILATIDPESLKELEETKIELQ